MIGLTSRRPRWRDSLLVLLLFLFAGLAVFLPTVRRVGEVRVYSVAAQRLSQGEQIYRTDEHPPFTYPPFFALPLVPLVHLPFAVQRAIWWFLNLTLLATIVLAATVMVWPVVKRGRACGRPGIWLNTLIIAVLGGRFLISPLEYESHDLIVLGLVLAAGVGLAVGRPNVAGISAGLAAACKATPLLLLPLLIWHRRGLASVLLVVTLVGATLLPDLLYPNSEGQLWVTCWYERFVSKVELGRAPEVQHTWSSWNVLNQSLSGTLYRLSTPVNPTWRQFDVSIWSPDAGTLRTITLLAQVGVIAFLAWITWPGRLARISESERSFFWLGQIGAVLCGMLLLSPMSSTQHFCALIIPITFCVTHWSYRRRNRFLVVTFVGLFLCGTLGAQDIVGATLEEWMRAYGSTTFCTLLCLLGSGFILVREYRACESTQGAEPQGKGPQWLPQRAA